MPMIGDRVAVDGRRGYVIEIGPMFATVLCDDDHVAMLRLPRLSERSKLYANGGARLRAATVPQPDDRPRSRLYGRAR